MLGLHFPGNTEPRGMLRRKRAYLWAWGLGAGCGRSLPVSEGAQADGRTPERAGSPEPLSSVVHSVQPSLVKTGSSRL